MIITTDSAWGRELTRWNTPRNQFVRMSDDSIALDINGQPMRGMGPIGHERYPLMMYQAHPLPNGQPSVGEVPPHPLYVTPQEYEHQCLFLDSFNRTCHRTVQSEAEERQAFNQGWRDSQQGALDLYEQREQELARAAAEAAHAAQRMSAKAQQEFAQAEDATHRHVADVPAPRRRRTRPRPPTPVGVPDAPPPPMTEPETLDPAPELEVVAEEPPAPAPTTRRGPGRPPGTPRLPGHVPKKRR